MTAPERRLAARRSLIEDRIRTALAEIAELKAELESMDEQQKEQERKEQREFIASRELNARLN